MQNMSAKLTLGAAVVAAAAFFTPVPGLLGATAFGVASAAPLGPQASLETDSGHVSLAKKWGPGGFAPCPMGGCGGGGGGKGWGGPGGFAPCPKGGCGGGGGGGGKGWGGGGGHHHNWRPGIGGALVLGVGYCSIRAARCDDIYGQGTYRYWRCLRRAGC